MKSMKRITTFCSILPSIDSVFGIVHKNIRNLFLLASLSMLGMTSEVHSGTQPKFTLSPTTSTAFLLPTNFIKTVQYRVTNRTTLTRILTIKPIPGVQQITTGSGFCKSPFILAPQKSCLLTLQINGNQIPSRIDGGPEVCKTQNPGNPSPDPFLCSQPAQRYSLAVSSVPPGQHAYVTNWVGNSISVCQVNLVDGFLEDCTVTATGFGNPEAIATNPDGKILYVANIGNSTVSYCRINSTTRALTNCQVSSGSFDHPDGIALNPAGTLAYVSNAVGKSVSICQVNSTTGALIMPCTIEQRAEFNTPSDMTLNSAGTLAYISNFTSNTVSICGVSGMALSSVCPSTNGNNLFNGPEGITLSPSGLFAYIANNGNNSITVCRVNSLGLLSECKRTDGRFDGFGNIGFNDLGTQAFVPNAILNRVFVCSADVSNGTLSLCKDSKGTGFNRPSGILLL